VLLCLAAMGFLSPDRRAVARSLAVVERMRVSDLPTSSLAHRPFLDRVARPSLVGMVVLARKLSSRGVAERLQYRLDVAGCPDGWTVDRLLGVKGLGLIGFGAVGVLVGRSSPFAAVCAGSVFAAAGFFLPNVLLYNTGLKRQERIRLALPDALDLLVICVEAGLGFDAAVANLARNTEGPLAGECYRLMQEMQIGKSRSQAFRSLADRNDLEELRSFTEAVVQADALGVPIARVLHEQAAAMRVKRRQLAEERAAKVPVKILFPLVVFILPALFVVVIGPGALSITHMFSR
jgi:tight adherence protein C